MINVEEAIDALEGYLGDDPRALAILDLVTKKVRNQSATLSQLQKAHAECPGKQGATIATNDRVQWLCRQIIKELE